MKTVECCVGGIRRCRSDAGDHSVAGRLTRISRLVIPHSVITQPAGATFHLYPNATAASRAITISRFRVRSAGSTEVTEHRFTRLNRFPHDPFLVICHMPHLTAAYRAGATVEPQRWPIQDIETFRPIHAINVCRASDHINAAFSGIRCITSRNQRYALAFRSSVHLADEHPALQRRYSAGTPLRRTNAVSVTGPASQPAVRANSIPNHSTARG